VPWRYNKGGIEGSQANEMPSKPPLVAHFAGSNAAMSPKYLRIYGLHPANSPNRQDFAGEEIDVMRLNIEQEC